MCGRKSTQRRTAPASPSTPSPHSCVPHTHHPSREAATRVGSWHDRSGEELQCRARAERTRVTLLPRCTHTHERVGRAWVIHDFAEDGGVLQLAFLLHLLPLYVELRFGRHRHQVDVLLAVRHAHVRMAHHRRSAAQLVPLVAVGIDTNTASPAQSPDEPVVSTTDDQKRFENVGTSVHHRAVVQLPTSTLPEDTFHVERRERWDTSFRRQ